MYDHHFSQAAKPLGFKELGAPLQPTYMAQGLGFIGVKMKGSGFRVWGSRFRVYVLRSKVLRFRVEGLWG